MGGMYETGGRRATVKPELQPSGTFRPDFANPVRAGSAVFRGIAKVAMFGCD